MATLKYFTRTKAKTGKLTPIYCRLRSGREIDQTAKSGINVQPDHFSNATGTIRPKADFTNRDQITKDLRDLKSHIFDELSAALTSPESIDGQWLRITVDKFHNPDKYKGRIHNLFSYIENFIEKAPSRRGSNGQPLSYQILKSYERTFYYLKEFAKKEGKTIDFDDITIPFYDDFTAFLQERDLALNSIGKAIRTLKTFLNAATDEGINTNLQYKTRRFVANSEESESIYLTEAEIDKIYKLDLSDNKRLDQVRDLFIVGCWIGQRYSDWNKVKPENIAGGFLRIRQQKTGHTVQIPIHETVGAIIAKYDGNLPPVISNNHFNSALREVAAKAEINEPVHKAITKGGTRISKKYPKWQLLSTHAARRSFATNLYNRGLDTYTIKAITGHRTESSFLQYIRVTPKEYAEKLQQFWSTPAPMKVVGGENNG